MSRAETLIKGTKKTKAETAKLRAIGNMTIDDNEGDDVGENENSGSFESFSEDEYLFFDGCSLAWRNKTDEVVASWTGVSGAKQESRKPFSEALKNAGPLPSTATYLVDPSKIQHRFEKWMVEKTSPLQLKYGIPSRPVEEYKYPIGRQENSLDGDYIASHFLLQVGLSRQLVTQTHFFFTEARMDGGRQGVSM